MYFGLTPDSVPFTRPQAAGPNAMARMPSTQWLSHLNPFPGVMNPMTAQSAYRAPFPAQAGPQALPPIPAPAAPESPVQPEAPQAPVPAQASRMFRGGGLNPYQVMRAGLFPAGGYSMRAGIANAPGQVRALTAPTYAQANRPAGTYMLPKR